MPDQSAYLDKVNSIAQEFAMQTSDQILKNIDNNASISHILSDLKEKVLKQAVELANFTSASLSDLEDSNEFLWDLNRNLPDFTSAFLYSSKMSMISIAAAVFLGWLAGGFLAAFLDLFHLGGGIIQAGAIFTAIYLEEQISSNPQIRNKILKYLGWGSLTAFAARVAAGMFRFAGNLFSGGLFRSIFGSLRPNIFKGAWLLIGVFFIFVFFSKKRAAPNINLFREELKKEIISRLNFLCLVLNLTGRLCNEIDKLKAKENSGKNLLEESSIITGIIDILDSLPDPQKSYLEDKLRQSGFVLENSGNRHFIWNEKSPKLYNPIGFISHGDECIILKKPIIFKDKIIKGMAQKFSGKNI